MLQVLRTVLPNLPYLLSTFRLEYPSVLSRFCLFNMLLIFKALMPLLANVTFRKGRFLVSVGPSTMTALKCLLEEISKIIP